MPPALVYVDTSTIEPGKLEVLKAALSDLAAYVDDHVPRAITYNTYISQDETRMTVVQVHPDSESLEHHMDVSGSQFPKFKDFLRLESIDVYGEPSPTLVEKLENKARMLGTGRVTIHAPHAGFDRYPEKIRSQGTA